MNVSRLKWVALAVALAPASVFAQSRVVVDDEPDAVLQVGGGVNDFTTGAR